MADMLRIEVAFATPERQQTVAIEVPRGTTIAEAVASSGLAAAFPTFDFHALPKGVWGQKQPESHTVKEGDRVEIYRPLIKQPMDARRERAEKKRQEKKRN